MFIAYDDVSVYLYISVMPRQRAQLVKKTLVAPCDLYTANIVCSPIRRGQRPRARLCVRVRAFPLPVADTSVDIVSCYTTCVNIWQKWK